MRSRLAGGRAPSHHGNAACGRRAARSTQHRDRALTMVVTQSHQHSQNPIPLLAGSPQIPFAQRADQFLGVGVLVLSGRSSCALHKPNVQRPERPQSHRCNWFCQIPSQRHPEVHDVLLRAIVTNGILGEKSTPAAAAAASAHWLCNALRRPIDLLEIGDEIGALLAIRNTGVAHRCPRNGRERIREKTIQCLLGPHDF